MCATNDVRSVCASAKALGRDCSNVHGDVRTHAEAGLLELDETGVRADYDATEIRAAI